MPRTETKSVEQVLPARSRQQRSLRRTAGSALVFCLCLLVSACGGGDSGIRVISPDEAYETVFESPPEGLVVLDVRTPDEFDGQRLPDAMLIDFYEADFADRIADLDRDAPYLMYCRSGNRSGQTRALMEELGFTDVRDVDGGIVSWLENGHPFVTSNG